jgi:hypothetical protein
MTNRHPADRLHDVREAIQELEAEEGRLRTYLLRHPEDRIGDEHEARIGTRQSKRVDMDTLTAEVGIVTVERHTRHRPVTCVRIVARSGSGEN